MEKDKISALREGRGDYESPVALSDETKTEILWWKEKSLYSSHDIDSSHIVIVSVASRTDWGSSCELGKTGGHWTSTEATCSINALEFQAGFCW